MIAARQFEWLADALASASLAGAVAFAVHTSLAPLAGQASALAAAGVAAALAYFIGRQMLSLVARGSGGADTAPRLPYSQPAAAPAAEVDARVVRSFDPAAVPAPLPTIVGNRQVAKTASAAPPDASQELRDALDQLRRSLRRA